MRQRARALLQSHDSPPVPRGIVPGPERHVFVRSRYTLHLRDIGFPSRWWGSRGPSASPARSRSVAFSGPLLKRFAPPTVLAFAFAGASPAGVALASLRFWPALLAIQPLHAVSFGMMWVASLAYTRDRSPPEILATAQGLFSASAGAGSVVGMLVWGELYKRGAAPSLLGSPRSRR